MRNLNAIQQAVAELRTESARLTAAIEANKREREDLTAAPMCKADLTAALLADLHRQGAELGPTLEKVAAFVGSRPLKDWSEHRQPVLPLSGGALAGLLANALADGLKSAMKSLPEIEGAGAPLAERRRRIAELDQAIAADEQQLRELREQAAAAGVSIAQSAY